VDAKPAVSNTPKRKRYHAPELVEFGSIAKLTQAILGSGTDLAIGTMML
jgi:hypothetical protein